MDERMTVCNMSIEGGARVGYVNPDETTFDYPARPPVRAAGRRRSTHAVAWWRQHRLRSRRALRRSRHASTPRRSSRPSPGASTRASRSRSTRGRSDARERGRSKRSRSWASRRDADPGHEDRRRVHRLVHQRPPLGPRGSGAHRQRPPGRAAREGAGRAGLAARSARAAEARGLARDLHRRRLRVARRRLLDVPGDEPGQARRAASSARRRPTATSRAGRAARPAARC